MPFFHAFDVLIPKPAYLPMWPVVACDQFTSQPEYWQELSRTIGDSPSALRCILPEAELADANAARYKTISDTMTDYLQRQIFDLYPDSFVFVERTLPNGAVRSGVVGVIDLEAYDYRAGASSPIRATERTVVERIPPRVKTRREATLDMSHILLLCDDEQRDLIEPLKHEKGKQLYDLALLQGGGTVRGRLIQGSAAAGFCSRLESYCERKRSEHSKLLFAAGDGNHSLAAAKECYEQMKKRAADAERLNRARYALVELESIYDDALEFEPIHRVVFNTDQTELLSFLERNCSENNGYAIKWFAAGKTGELLLDTDGGRLPAEVVQSALDDYLCGHEGKLDYIHGAETLTQLVEKQNGVGFMLPGISKQGFFERIEKQGVFPRKMFSMGEAAEKRYYLETRAL